MFIFVPGIIRLYLVRIKVVSVHPYSDVDKHSGLMRTDETFDSH